MVHEKVLEAYKKNNYDYYTRAEDDREKIFFEQAEASKNEIDHQINQVFRLRKGNKEKMYYQETLRSKDYLGNAIDHSRTVGKYKMPQFVNRLDPQSGKPLPVEISGHDEVYDLDFDVKRLEHLVKQGSINEETNFVLITLGRRYGGFSYDEFVSNTFDDLHSIGKYGTTNINVIKKINDKKALDGKIK